MNNIEILTKGYADSVFASRPVVKEITSNDGSITVTPGADGKVDLHADKGLTLPIEADGHVIIPNTRAFIGPVDSSGYIMVGDNGSIAIKSNHGIEIGSDTTFVVGPGEHVYLHGTELTNGGASYQYISERDNHLFLEAPNTYLGETSGYINIGEMGARKIDINGPAYFSDKIIDKNGNEITADGGSSYLYISEDKTTGYCISFGGNGCQSVFIDGPTLYAHKIVGYDIVGGTNGYKTFSIGAHESSPRLKFDTEKNNLRISPSSNSLYISGPIWFDDGPVYFNRSIYDKNGTEITGGGGGGTVDIKHLSSGDSYISVGTDPGCFTVEIGDKNNYTNVEIDGQNIYLDSPNVCIRNGALKAVNSQYNSTSLYIDGPVKFNSPLDFDGSAYINGPTIIKPNNQAHPDNSIKIRTFTPQGLSSDENVTCLELQNECYQGEDYVKLNLYAGTSGLMDIIGGSVQSSDIKYPFIGTCGYSGGTLYLCSGEYGRVETRVGSGGTIELGIGSTSLLLDETKLQKLANFIDTL